MRKIRLKRFVLEIVLDTSYFERNKKSRRVYRYRTESKFISIRAKNLKNAKKKALNVLASDKDGLLIDYVLYKRVEFAWR